MRTEPTRRAVVAAAGALLLAGCKGIAVLGPLPKPGADVITLDHAIADEEVMIASYRAALAGLAGDAHAAAVVGGMLAEHERHLAALRARLVLPPRLATARPRPSPTPPALPSGRRQVVAALADAERAASIRLAGQLLAVPPPLAQLMASIGASEAAHAVILEQARLG